MSNIEPFRDNFRDLLNQATDLEAAVMMTVGAASVCWSESPTGTFESDRAAVVGSELIRWIETQNGAPQ